MRFFMFKSLSTFEGPHLDVSSDTLCRILGLNLQSYHQSFVSTAPPPMGMGGDSDFSLFRALV